MTDLSKEAMDALVNELRTGHPLDIDGDRAADAITSLRAENEALKEAHGEQERYLCEAEKWKARATAAEAALTAAMEGAVRVKPIKFTKRGVEWWGSTPFGPYVVARVQFDEAPDAWCFWPPDADEDDKEDAAGKFVAERKALAAAQADYERRILAAIDPAQIVKDMEGE